MVKKLLVGLLVLVIVFGMGSSFWARPAQANTGSERLLCAAEPWDDWEWNKASPPSPSGSDSTYSSVNSTNPGVMVEPQKVQQKPQKSFWSQLQFFLFNLKLLLGGK